MGRFRVTTAVLVFLGASVLWAANPSWWEPAFIDNGAGVSHETSNNYAPANLGQLKNVAKKAALHLNDKLSPYGGAGPEILGIVNNFTPNETQTEVQKAQARAENYVPINLGQLKAVAKPFYDRLRNSPINYNTRANLITRGFQFPSDWPSDNPYPWNPNTAIADNYAPANIGQLKMAFSFDLAGFSVPNPDEDDNGNGLPNGYEGTLGGAGPEGDNDGDGLSNLTEYLQGSDPLVAKGTGPAFSATGLKVFTPLEN